jgi:hypothetical protein
MPHADVLLHRQGVRQPRLLEGATDPRSRPHEARPPGDVLAPQGHPSLIEGHEAGQGIEQRGLPGAVRAHDSQALPRSKSDAHVVDGAHAAEVDHDPLALKTLRLADPLSREPSCLGSADQGRRPHAMSVAVAAVAAGGGPGRTQLSHPARPLLTIG